MYALKNETSNFQGLLFFRNKIFSLKSYVLSVIKHKSIQFFAMYRMSQRHVTINYEVK